MNSKIKTISLQQIEKYIKLNYNYKTNIKNDELVITYNKNTLIIKIHTTKEGACFDDTKWISINNMKGLGGFVRRKDEELSGEYRLYTKEKLKQYFTKKV